MVKPDRSVKAKYASGGDGKHSYVLRRPDMTLSQWQHPPQLLKTFMVLLKNYSKLCWSQKIKLRRHFKISLKWLKFLRSVKKGIFKSFLLVKKRVHHLTECVAHTHTEQLGEAGLWCATASASPQCHRECSLSGVTPPACSRPTDWGNRSARSWPFLCKPFSLAEVSQRLLCPVHAVSAVWPRKWNFSAFPPLLQPGKPDLS